MMQSQEKRLNIMPEFCRQKPSMKFENMLPQLTGQINLLPNSLFIAVENRSH